MESAIIIVHVVMAIAIIGLVLIQQGKGADAAHPSVVVHRKPSSVHPAVATS